LEFLNQQFSLADDACRLIAFMIVAGGIWIIVSRISEELSGVEGMARESGEILSKTKMDLMVLENHRNRLFKNLAKELSLPIHAITDQLSEVEKTVTGGDLSKVTINLNSLRNEIDGLRDISGDLDWLSEPHWHQRNYKKEKVDLMVLLAKEVSRKALSAKEKNIVLTLTGPKKLQINADRRSIQQMISQLLSNAIKYTPAGRGDILLELEREVPFAVFSIQDHGVGIPEGEKKNLFQEFFRSSNAENIKTSGSGLGLYIVKEIVDWHRGLIKVESTLDKGTTVTVWLPLEENQE
jgi:signal transduction histidine kinase